MEALQVARFYSVSPVEVENWFMFEFLDRQEYMFVCFETDDRVQKYFENQG